ncbi:hypothetical protein XOC_0968 [Xanthomonas oryzae pv. oryzicola BLS256]|uniref:Uncharacterized protein n=1 Tax=Xanthomonas oryzae pv. oryzicola (strain BLS256) TaxID=383407 RepID=G7TEJ5_XANOB|nr:hypothetical protein XOC_0968 [Xanthomonas oryzae pv. oryzicola BLS256]QEO98955.1 hypothetical protein XOCgx_3968 [Xanthomonas oryzae pv. oryzicola]
MVTARVSRRTGLKSHAQRLPASAGVKIFIRGKTDAAPTSAFAW